jgi:hypothetical protein
VGTGLGEGIVAEKYGLRLTVEQLGKALNLAPQTIHHKIAKGEFRVPTSVERGKRFCDSRDLALHLDSVRGQIQA